MSIEEKKRSILGVIAHPDDIELMAGGTLARLVKEGHKIHVLTFTDGAWHSPAGKLIRDGKEALLEEEKAAEYLGYTLENLKYKALHMEFQDRHVCEILDRIDRYKIDTIICPWERDSHHDHEVVSRLVDSASRRVPRILMGQINYHSTEVFKPNLYVDISDTWEQKIKSLECYETEWKRQREDWYEFLDITTSYYGKMIGVKRAEGFVTKKYLY